MDVLMTGERKVGSATLELVKTNAVPEHLRNSIREITKLSTIKTERRKGFATALLNMICYEADKHKILLILKPDAMGAMSNKRLVKFYQSFGFKQIQNGPILMARQVHG